MVERITLCFDNLPEEFNNVRVAAIADLHADRRWGGEAGIKQVVETANSLEPDVIVLLGDMVHTRRGVRHIRLLGDLEAKYGVWACPGNHEHGTVRLLRWAVHAGGLSVEQWREIYGEAGATLLVNEADVVERGDARIWIVGVDDAYSNADDLAVALEGTSREEFRLGITHHPDLIDNPRAGELDVILAAHTHGGQVKFPFLGLPHVSCRKPNERAAGLSRENGTMMYVTRGVGEAIPLRLGCPRELTLLTLTR